MSLFLYMYTYVIRIHMYGMTMMSLIVVLQDNFLVQYEMVEDPPVVPRR